MIEGAIISIIQRETQNRTLAINTGQNLFPTFFGQRLQASIYRYLKHLLSETIHPKVESILIIIGIIHKTYKYEE